VAIIALGYLGIRSDKLEDWSVFASKLLGMQEIDRGGQSLAFRMDDRKQRLVVSSPEPPAAACRRSSREARRRRRGSADPRR